MSARASLPLAVVVLAAGKGSRMRSKRHKVLHSIAERPMLLHLLDRVSALAPGRIVVVVGEYREQVVELLGGCDVTVAVQEQQLGTGHAVLQAQAALAGFDGPVLILYGDTPLVTAETLGAMLGRLAAEDSPAVVVLASSPPDPAAYGRVIRAGSERIARMVEYRDASDTERAERLCNSGMMAIGASDLWRLLAAVGNANAAGEYYLPDIVNLAIAQDRLAVVVEADPFETAGINSRAELAAIEAEWQRRRRLEAMADGASLVDPDSVWFAHDTRLGRDVVIEPHVVFGAGVEVGDDVRIRAFSHIAGARIAAGAEIGPFARLRPGTDIGQGAKIGNFVEVKNARFASGAKASHLSYIGDAEVGAKANIGAGTITCNYDGIAKHRTTIGAGAFIGSNSALVAPVTVGEGAIVAAGSVITRDVEPDSLALARGEQRGIAGWARRFRSRAQGASGPE